MTTVRQLVKMKTTVADGAGRIRKHAVALIGTLFYFSAVLLPRSASQSLPSIPHLTHEQETFHLYVDDQPYLVLGGQVHNSSATNVDDLKAAMDSVVAIHGNTVEVPVYWELVEPTAGKFDFHLIDETLAQARAHHLRVALLWFGTWKNAWMTYTPEWVKRDRKQFHRAVDASGKEMGTLSAFSEPARNADAHAFQEVVKHIKENDESRRTVILVQVENETGLLLTDRDHSPEAEAAYQQSPPPELLNYLEAHRRTLSASLAGVLDKSSGTANHKNWQDYFGELAPEVFSAWFTARYVDSVAEAGKKVYPLPMFANDWLMGPGDERAGRWPSGGPSANVIDIWKAAAPHIDMVAPDIYNPDFPGSIAAYRRDDNALLIPEIIADAHWAGYVFPALAQYDAIGFSPFGVDHWLEEERLKTVAQPFADNYRVLRPLLPLIAKYQGTGFLHGFVQDQLPGQVIRLGKTELTVARVDYTQPFDLKGALGAGLILELGTDDFVVAGTNFVVTFRAMEGPLRDRIPLTIEEGNFDGERWSPTRRLNGDEFEIKLPETGGVRRVRLLE